VKWYVFQLWQESGDEDQQNEDATSDISNYCEIIDKGICFEENQLRTLQSKKKNSGKDNNYKNNIEIILGSWKSNDNHDIGLGWDDNEHVCESDNK